ncbi:hypothetical protein PV327_005254 [Microctonus hyperodae]|uniref:Uncharacterized protein n=1 Tax=Microctonus hyperodae TaxID=165561 RepID=A0AA39G2F4_MICHY|nr:hypothetical protein PV327_005254 [Microctonus hyperodae]
MENRPAPLRSRRVCRFCLTESEPLSFIYERDHSKPFQVPLTLQIMSCVAIEVYSADGMPQMICNMCRWNLDRSYKFKHQCKKADEALRAYPITGVLPRPFPPINNEAPESAGNKRPAEQRNVQSDQLKKARVDNGDRERRERERERQESSNIKSDRNDLYKEEQRDTDNDEEEEVNDDKDDRKLEPGEIRVHSCDQCERTFPLRQSLQLHIERVHRDRNFKCTVCERMFFTKYDLQKHMSIHSEEKPYSCTICNKTFTRANLLQRHEKIHREDLRFSCDHCDREFFSREELEKHEDNSHKTTKPFQCNICNKRFTYKQGLERHEMLHAEDKSFTCEYCKEAFRTSTKLARHLQTHSGHRPHLCKICPRKFLFSHHLTRHMRSHSVEKRHICEECGKAFKRKESLEVHQLTHSKRGGMGLTCDVCQESCRNRADYVTHIKQHIEAGEKMGPDGLQPDTKVKLESESEEEEEDEDQYSDGDDDYEPPAYVAKKYPKKVVKQQSEESEEDPGDRIDKEDRKEQVVFIRGKDGQIVKKTIKTLMPIQRQRESTGSDVRTPSKSITTTTTTSSTSQQSAIKVNQQQGANNKQSDDSSKGRLDDTEAEVQKIVASVFKEHKIPLKHTNIPQEQIIKAESGGLGHQQTSRSQPLVPSIKEEKSEAAAAKSVNTVKVIKRIVVRKPAGGDTSITTPSKEIIDAVSKTVQSNLATSGGGSTGKVTKRVIVRRIIRQGDTTREVIMNPDGTIIDPSELAKLPTGNVVKRVVVKKPVDKTQNIIQSSTEQRTDSSKFELKTAQVSSAVNIPSDKAIVVQKVEVKKTSPAVSAAVLSKGDQETKEKLEQLEKRVEQQRLKIEELQARKQQEYEAIDDMLPERHDSEDEQELPLKRVFVKRKQCIYDEEQEYNDANDEKNDGKVVGNDSNDSKSKELKENVEAKKIVYIKAEEPSEVEQMSRELNSILDSTDNVVKMQENVVTNLTEISGIAINVQAENDVITNEKLTDESSTKINDDDVTNTGEKNSDVVKGKEHGDEQNNSEQTLEMEVDNEQQAQTQYTESEAAISLDQQPDLSESTDIFETSDSPLVQKTSQNLDDSVIALSHVNETINLNDTNDSQDSLEDKLSQMEG